MPNDSNNQLIVMRYGLDDPVPPAENIAYAFQHLIYFLAGSVVIPVAVGNSLGLGQDAIAVMLQSTFVLSGVASILQTIFGHGYPIVDGPSAVWMGIIVAIASSVQSAGGDLASLRASLQLGMIVGGAILALLSILGLSNWLAGKFTPVMNGAMMILCVIQLSASVMKNALGISDANSSMNGQSLAVFLLTAAVIIIINMKTAGFIRSIATLIGVTIGWIISIVVKLPANRIVVNAIIALPKPFAWGTPTLDWSVVFTCAVCSVILLSNFFISVHGMADVLGEVAAHRIKRSTAVFGVVTALCGVFPTVGFCPFASSMGVVTMTRVAARRPFILGGIFIILLGLIAPVGSFFATMPAAVSYGANMIIFALIFAQGVHELQKVTFTNRESLISGMQIIIGAGIMFLPSYAFEGMPELLRFIMSNGLVVGFFVGFLMEHVLLRKKN